MALDMQSVYILATGGSRAMEQLDTTANNLANVNTTGFKKLIIKEMSQRLDENGADSNHLFVFPRFQDSLLQLTQGSLKHTQNPLDLAIDGEGFFLVQRGNQQLLTRNGHFLINEEGRVVDANGNSVLDDSKKPIVLDTAIRFDITKDGTIYQNGEVVAKLAVKMFQNVKPVGDSYFQGQNEQEGNYKVLQGYLEQSNVNPMLEMTSLITAQRRFDMYSNLIKSLDGLNQKTNEIGKA